MILNSPERWLAEHGKRLPDGTGRGLVLDYMERYCARHADFVTCPSQALLNWMRADGWHLPSTARWLPTYSPPVKSFKLQPSDPYHLVFFGRLETRKGLELFATALTLLAKKESAAQQLLRITFLGKVAMATGNISSESYLKQSLEGLPAAWKWETL